MAAQLHALLDSDDIPKDSSAEQHPQWHEDLGPEHKLSGLALGSTANCSVSAGCKLFQMSWTTVGARSQPLAAVVDRTLIKWGRNTAFDSSSRMKPGRLSRRPDGSASITGLVRSPL
jgi:hypothetical protein